MNNLFYTICCILILAMSTSHAQGFKKFTDAINDVVGSESSSNALSDDIIADGLKEALATGVEKGVAQLSKPDGFFKDLSIKILLPEEAQRLRRP